MATCGLPSVMGTRSGASRPVGPSASSASRRRLADPSSSRPDPMATSGSPRSLRARLGTLPRARACGQAAAAERRADGSSGGLVPLPSPGGSLEALAGEASLAWLAVNTVTKNPQLRASGLRQQKIRQCSPVAVLPSSRTLWKLQRKVLLHTTLIDATIRDEVGMMPDRSPQILRQPTPS